MKKYFALNILLKTQGQALVETMLTIVFLTIICFASLEVCIIVANDLIANESAYALARTMVVKKDIEKQYNPMATLAGIALMGAHASSVFLPYSMEANETGRGNLKYFDGTTFERYEAVLYYKNLLSFSSLLNPVKVFGVTIGGNPVRSFHSRVKFVKSPGSEYYDKAYYGAKKFDN